MTRTILYVLGSTPLLGPALRRMHGRARRLRLARLDLLAAIYDVSVQEVYAVAGIVSEPGMSS